MHWLTESWRTYFESPWREMLLAVLAVVCGWIVGTEREKHEKAAGLRTLILVCVGSSAFTMASFIFNTRADDSGRVAAQIVTGIGFLGGGVIMHGRNTIVSGTTTAATIWVAAAIGMLVGAGYPGGALGLSILVRCVLSLIRFVETNVSGEREGAFVEIAYEPCEGITRVRLERLLAGYHAKTVAAKWLPSVEGRERLELRLRLRCVHLHELLDEIVSVEGVKSIVERPLRQG